MVLTGCDCGFGRDAAFALGDRGFVVFAGCRSVESSGKQFAGECKVQASERCFMMMLEMILTITENWHVFLCN